MLSVEELDCPEPGEGEVLVEMLASPVNPADLNIIEGKYGQLPDLPATIGNEGVGRVARLGPGAAGISEGDLVLPLTRGNWMQFQTAPALQVMRLPAGLDVFQAAMLSANPPSAWGMLEDFVPLKGGDWIVQNAANSAVGRCVIQIARSRGIRTLNVVRREELVDELKAIGADEVVLEKANLQEIAPSLCGESLPKLGLNGVGGASALNLANALAYEGTLVTYGAMARQPLKIPNGLLIFKGLKFEGFWLRRMVEDGARMREAVTALAELSAQGSLHMAVHKVFGLTELHAALEEAGREQRSGKVLIDLQR